MGRQQHTGRPGLLPYGNLVRFEKLDSPNAWEMARNTRCRRPRWEGNVFYLKDGGLAGFLTQAFFSNERPLWVEADRAEPFFLDLPRSVRLSELHSSAYYSDGDLIQFNFPHCGGFALFSSHFPDYKTVAFFCLYCSRSRKSRCVILSLSRNRQNEQRSQQRNKSTFEALSHNSPPVLSDRLLQQTPLPCGPPERIRIASPIFRVLRSADLQEGTILGEELSIGLDQDFLVLFCHTSPKLA